MSVYSPSSLYFHYYASSKLTFSESRFRRHELYLMTCVATFPLSARYAHRRALFPISHHPCCNIMRQQAMGSKWYSTEPFTIAESELSRTPLLPPFLRQQHSIGCPCQHSGMRLASRRSHNVGFLVTRPDHSPHLYEFSLSGIHRVIGHLFHCVA